MKKTPSKRQMAYAREYMEGGKSRQVMAINAGYSPSSARVPGLIENKQGFKLAIGILLGQSGHVLSKVFYEINTRDLEQMDNKDLINLLKTATNTWEKLHSKM